MSFCFRFFDYQVVVWSTGRFLVVCADSTKKDKLVVCLSISGWKFAPSSLRFYMDEEETSGVEAPESC